MNTVSLYTERQVLQAENGGTLSDIRCALMFAVHLLPSYHLFVSLHVAEALASVRYFNYRVALKLRAIQTALLCAWGEGGHGVRMLSCACCIAAPLGL